MKFCDYRFYKPTPTPSGMLRGSLILSAWGVLHPDCSWPQIEDIRQDMFAWRPDGHSVLPADILLPCPEIKDANKQQIYHTWLDGWTPKVGEEFCQRRREKVLEVKSLYPSALVTFANTLDAMRARDPQNLQRNGELNALALERLVPVCDLIDYPMYLHQPTLHYIEAARQEIRRLRKTLDDAGLSAMKLMARFWWVARRPDPDNPSVPDWTTPVSMPVWRAGWDMLQAELHSDDIAAAYCESQPAEWDEAPWWTEFLSRAGV